MDNNNLTSPSPMVNSQSVPTSPIQPVMPQNPVSAPNSGSSNKMILYFVIGLVLVIALVGGIYFYLNQKQANTLKETTAIQTPAPSPSEDLEEELNSINVETASTSSDFAPVDQDLNQL